MMKRAPRRGVKGPRFDGGRVLDAYLRSINQSVPSFCDEHGLDRFAVQRYIVGKAKRPPLIELALGISRATKGHVSIYLWRESSLTADESGDFRAIDADDVAKAS